MPENKNPIGRPSIKTPELVDAILERLMHGETLRSICRDPSMPGRDTIYRWLLDDREFQDQYSKARECGFDCMFEEALAIADTDDLESVNRDRLRIDTRKWFLARALPRKYGDKVEQTLIGDAERPIRSESVQRVYRYTVVRPDNSHVLDDGNDRKEKE